MEASKFFSRRDPSLRGTRRQLLSPSLTQSNSIGRDADDDGTYAPGQSLLDFPGSLEFKALHMGKAFLTFLARFPLCLSR